MFLYRYYGNEDHILCVVTSRRLHFCLPSEFNDPFDCRPLISIKYSKCNDDNTWYKFLFYLAKTQYAGLPETEVKKHADAAFAKELHKDQSWLKQVDHHLKETGTLVRVCCFSKSPRNMMMWAHYARNHKGLLFQFRASGLHDRASGSFRGYDVNYAPAFLGVQDYADALENGIEHADPLEMARLFYCTKTKHWATEEEVRFFSDKEQKYVAFDEPTLTGIVFGDQCPEPFIGKVLAELAKWQRKPRLFKACIKDSSHKLWIGSYRGTQQAPCTQTARSGV